MNGISDDVDTGDLSSPITNNGELSNISLNVTDSSTKNIFGVTDEMKRILLIALVIIILLICLILCISICICFCLKRRRNSKDEQRKDQLLPETTAKGSFSKSSKVPRIIDSKANGKQRTSMQSSSSNAVAVGATSGTGKPLFYDNFDDIPFIDESRPNSVIDITQV